MKITTEQRKIISEKHRLYMVKWREENRPQYREITRKAGKKYYWKYHAKNRLRSNKWNRLHPEKIQQYMLHHRYEINRETWVHLLKKQNGLCAICRGDNNGSRLHVDHHHVTNKIRGLLCFSCNVGLGNFKDDSERLRKAVRYLDKQK